MNKVSLQQLQIIERVVSEGSITKAAAQLFLTQPAISHQLRDLEDKLGLKLFDRVGKKLIPNDACQTIVATANNVLPQLEELNRQLKNFKEGKNQIIRLSTECYTCYHWLPKVVQKFRKNRSNIEVRIVVEATQQPIDYLERGELDIAIVGKQPANKNLFVTPLFEDEMVAVLPKAHRLTRKAEPLEASDFADENFIYYNVPDKNNLILDDYFGATKPRVVQKVQLTEAIIEMVSAEMGVSIMATWAVKPYLRTRNLAVCNLSGSHTKKNWLAVTRSQQTKIFNQFVQTLKTRF